MAIIETKTNQSCFGKGLDLDLKVTQDYFCVKLKQKKK